MIKIKTYTQIIEGKRGPRFYLPVRRNSINYSLEYWIFPLALIVMPYFLFISICRLIWHDLVRWQIDLTSEINKPDQLSDRQEV